MGLLILKNFFLGLKVKQTPLLQYLLLVGFGPSWRYDYDDHHIGVYDDVRALEKENKLQDLLK